MEVTRIQEDRLAALMQQVLRPEPISVKKLDDRAVMPSYGTERSAGFDLAVLNATFVHPTDTVLAPTGLVIAAPAGHMLLLTPRSSTWKRYGVRLANTVGVVDEDYCGEDDEIALNLWNPHPTPVSIPAGTRVAQGIFVPVTNHVEFVEEADMGSSRGGWGSTGV